MKLYNYQQTKADEGLEILKEHKMLYLAFSPRYGKTPITMDILSKVNDIHTVLWVTTKSAIDGIKHVYDEMNPKFRIRIINYESLHKAEHKNWDAVVLDESHANLSAFPKPTKRWKELKKLNWEYTVWLSGTPQIESSSQMYHQLALSKYHPFAAYKNFYAFHKELGIQGLTIPIGYGRNAKDYSETVNFSDKYRDFLLRGTLEDAETAFKQPVIKKVSILLPDHVKSLYDQMWRHSVVKVRGEMIAATNAAAKYSKCQQICGGTILDEEGNTYMLSSYRANYIADIINADTAVFYKYKAEKDLLSVFIPEEQLFQIDSQNTGIDLSHFHTMIIYSLTYSGSSFTQVLSRLTNIGRDTHPVIKIIVAEDTIEEDIFKVVMDKKDENQKFLLKEIE